LRLTRSRNTTSGGWVTGGGFYDTQRAEGCSFAVAKDGTLHCMPIASPPIDPHYFADASCTQPLYRFLEQCGPNVPKYLRGTDSTTCPARQRIFVTGAKHSGPVYEKYGDGPCTQDTGTADQLVFYVRGAEVEPSELVEGSDLVP
jgi:hypothetical protein